MKPRHAAWLGLAAIALLACVPQESQSVPVFARKYGFNCTMCHSDFPRLNDFGQRYRMNGYALPGRENEEKSVLETSAPVALRTSAGYNDERLDTPGGCDNAYAFEINGLDLLSGGLLGRTVGYFMIYVPQIAAARGVAEQEGGLEMASVVFQRLGSSWVNLRVGRFETACVPFSVKRSLSVSPYEIYEAAFPGGVPFSETQSGIEVSGWGKLPLRYAVGLVSGGETNLADDPPADVYARAAYVIGAGEGQTMGQRIGVIGYLGKAPSEADSAGARQTFSRFGAEASLNAFHCNLALQYLFGQDDAELWPGAEENDEVSWSGGFAELSWRPQVGRVVFARYDWVDAPSDFNADVGRATVGARHYFGDNVALHLEYSHRTEKSWWGSALAGGDDTTLSFFTARVDFAL